MKLPKHKIRLSRHLKAQTTPYPEAGKWLKRGALLLIAILAVGIYTLSKDQQAQTARQEPAQEKQILGEQDNPVEYQTHTVKQGDTLFTISQQFEVSWQKLAEINNLEEPYLLRVGQELRIPKQ